MSTVEDIRQIGILQAERRPLRALVLATLSRLMVGALLIATAWAANAVRSVAADEGIHARPLRVVEGPVVATSGTSVGALLEDVRVRVVADGGRVVAGEVTRRSGADATVRLTAELPGSGAADVDRLVVSLRHTELDDLATRAVDPVPSGLRVTLDASLALAAARPSATRPDRSAAAVALAQAAERSGTELRGVDVPDQPQEPVRLAAAGELAALIRLVDVIEREHSAPRRIRSLALTRTSSGTYELAMSFSLREDAPPATSGAPS